LFFSGIFLCPIFVLHEGDSHNEFISSLFVRLNIVGDYEMTSSTRLERYSEVSSFFRKLFQVHANERCVNDRISIFHF